MKLWIELMNLPVSHSGYVLLLPKVRKITVHDVLHSLLEIAFARPDSWHPGGLLRCAL